jgi:23S rRNA pseudouridine2457 synthase
MSFSPACKESTLHTAGSNAKAGLRYILLNKPYGYLCSFTDPETRLGRPARPTLSDLVEIDGIYAAGRLDLDSEGLLLLTDDGDLAHRLTHPRHAHLKRYLAQVEGLPEAVSIEALRAGVRIKGDHRTAPAEARLLDDAPELWDRDPPIRQRSSIPTTWIELGLREGRKRQVRQMTAAVGHPTLRLVRVAIGGLTLGSLGPGEWRELGEDERMRLLQASKLPEPAIRRKRPSGPRSESSRSKPRAGGAPAGGRRPPRRDATSER